jgi:hypothetical protein
MPKLLSNNNNTCSSVIYHANCYKSGWISPYSFDLIIYDWMSCVECDKIYNSWKVMLFLLRLESQSFAAELVAMKKFVNFHKFYSMWMEKRLEELELEERERKSFMFGVYGCAVNNTAAHIPYIVSS